MKSVLIIGSGLLGLSLAKKFSNNDYHLSITTTTENKLLILRNMGYNPIMFNSNMIEHYEKFSELKVDVLVFALPPSKCKVIAYKDVLSNICINLNSFNLLVFTSSISVYSNNGENHSEKNEAIETNSILYKTELYIKKNIKHYYIFRLGGLVDKQRHPQGFHKDLNVKNSNAPINLVQIKDVSNIIYSSITNNINIGVYNVCSPIHPSKKEYYGTFNKNLIFSEGDLGKTVNGTLISNMISYTYNSIYDFDAD